MLRVIVETTAPKLPNGTAYLCLESYVHQPDYTVVWVDPMSFKPFWEHTDRTQSALWPSEWPERKRKETIEGLTIGTENPCPIAVVNFYVSDGECLFGFTNGMSRTAMLMESGANAVPLAIRKEEASAFLNFVRGFEDPMLWRAHAIEQYEDQPVLGSFTPESTISKMQREALIKRLHRQPGIGFMP